MQLSLVIPAHNEEESLSELVSQIKEANSAMDVFQWEILFIDDGSTDSTWKEITRLSADCPNIRGFRFQSNMGKAAALALGFQEARGESVITMDADLQDNPAEIQPLLKMLEEGFDLVSGWKKKRHDPWHKTLPSKLFNLVVSKVAGIRLHDFNCGLKAYKKAVTKSVTLYGDFHRFIPVMAKWNGFCVGEKVVEHRARQHGVSKYGVSRLLSGFFDLVTLVFLHRWAVKPLHFFGGIGFLFALIGGSILGWFGIEWLIKGELHVRPLMLMGGFAMIMGIQFGSLGLIAEMISGASSMQKDFPIAEQIAGGIS